MGWGGILCGAGNEKTPMFWVVFNKFIAKKLKKISRHFVFGFVRCVHRWLGVCWVKIICKVVGFMLCFYCKRVLLKMVGFGRRGGDIQKAHNVYYV